VTLLMCVQGVVALQDALPEVATAAFLPLNTTSATESHGEDTHEKVGKEKGKGKGKKGKGAKSDGRESPVEAAAAPAVSAGQVKESARRGIFPVYAGCSMFVTELFQVRHDALFFDSSRVN
jgi:hypothetical protein